MQADQFVIRMLDEVAKAMVPNVSCSPLNDTISHNVKPPDNISIHNEASSHSINAEPNEPLREYPYRL